MEVEFIFYRVRLPDKDHKNVSDWFEFKAKGNEEGANGIIH